MKKTFNTRIAIAFLAIAILASSCCEFWCGCGGNRGADRQHNERPHGGQHR